MILVEKLWLKETLEAKNRGKKSLFHVERRKYCYKRSYFRELCKKAVDGLSLPYNYAVQLCSINYKLCYSVQKGFCSQSMQKKSQDLKLLNIRRFNRYQNRRDFLKCVLIALLGRAFLSAIRLGTSQGNDVSKVINF